MKSNLSIFASVILLGASSATNATIIGFGNLGGNNTTVPSSLGSSATADGNGFVVSNGATPNVTLTWDANWDIHTSSHFANLENLTVGGGAWDNEGNIPRIGQLDFGDHTIEFTPQAGFAVVINSFDFGHSPEGYPATPGGSPNVPNTGEISWNLTLTDSSLNTVWQETVNFVGGQAFTISPNFVGNFGESYTLNFNRTSQFVGANPIDSNGRHGIDNLSFNQVQIPEPSTAALLGVAGLALFSRRRK